MHARWGVLSGLPGRGPVAGWPELCSGQPGPYSGRHWSKKKKIDSIGYIHATMPFWHLNYYQTKSFNQKNIYLPNKIFTVSKINLELLLNQGIRKNKLKLVEALRYNWLNNVKKEKFSNSSNKILVLVTFINIVIIQCNDVENIFYI